jgi:hypothetical protein
VRRNVRAGAWQLDEAQLAEVREVLGDLGGGAPAR